MYKLIRVTTVPRSLAVFCRGQLRELREQDGYEVVAVSSPGPELDEVGLREGVATHGVAMRRRMSPLRDLRSLWGLVRVFRRERPVMVHSMTPKAGLLSMMAAWLCRVPVRVHTFTGLVFPTATGLTQKILILTDRLTCACATHIIPEGEGVRQDLIKYRITRKNLRVLGHGNVRGIDLAHYSPDAPGVTEAAATLRHEGVLTFVFVGRLVGDKGINELVEAFSAINREFPATRLVLVGPEESALDPLRPETVAEIDRNPAIDAVGRQDDVRPWLAASDALVFPSYREGFPNVVIEAGAMGLPSVVTDINGSREIILDGKNGLIVPPRDCAALQRAMRRLLTDGSLRAYLAANARPMVASRYEQGDVRRCLKEFYKEILAEI